MNIINWTAGGVCAAKGFTASGFHCGIRRNQNKKDLALIYSKVPAQAAAVYTQNLVKGAPLIVTKKHLENGVARAIICNSGNANTCNADGVEIAEKMCAQVSRQICGFPPEDVIVASTGVIGQPLNLDPIMSGIMYLRRSLTAEGSHDAAEAIMTTDTQPKELAVEFTVGGKVCRLGAIAKGSGMIHPNMATMLVFITTDCAVSHGMLQRALSEDVKGTFNMLSIDGDTSTNDMMAIMANGLAENPEITGPGEDYDIFAAALRRVTKELCRRMAADGEGATKLLVCEVSHAKDLETARTVAKSVICSSLVKAALFGADANWGRVLCAIGYSGADVDVNRVDVDFESDEGCVHVCQDGAGLDFSEEDAKRILLEKEVRIRVDLNSGDQEATAWGCDLTYDYVKINGDYRT